MRRYAHEIDATCARGKTGKLSKKEERAVCTWLSGFRNFLVAFNLANKGMMNLESNTKLM